LRPAMVGQRIERAQVFWPRTIALPSSRAFTRRVAGQSVRSVGRRAKYLVFALSGGDVLATHLRMTGDFSLQPSGTPPDSYVRVGFTGSGAQALWFPAVRKCGRMALTRDPEAFSAHLGPEPLSRRFTARVLAGIVQGRSTPIKVLLLNQQRIAGLGNIYA